MELAFSVVKSVAVTVVLANGVDKRLTLICKCVPANLWVDLSCTPRKLVHGNTVRCHDDTVRCHGDTVCCHGDTVRCHGDTVCCHGDTVRCSTVLCVTCDVLLFCGQPHSAL